MIFIYQITFDNGLYINLLAFFSLCTLTKQHLGNSTHTFSESVLHGAHRKLMIALPLYGRGEVELMERGINCDITVDPDP